jgi:hypothetical protein
MLSSLPKQKDFYISQEVMRRPGRRVVDLSCLGVSFTDLETHKSKDYRNLTPEQQARALLLYCEDEGIPRPSLINYSGRGLHAKWPYDDAVPAMAYPRWAALQRELREKLTPFHPDPAAHSGAQVLRMVGSINSRSGEECRIVYDDGARWPFEALCREVLPFFREELQSRRKETRAAAGKGGNVANLFSPRQLWWCRLLEMRKLISMRGWERGVPEGSRNNFVFVAACALAWCGEVTDLEEETAAFAREFTPSLRPHEALTYAGTALRLARAGRRYRLSSEKIVELLDVQPDEQRLLKHLVAPDVRNDRRRQYDRERNRKECDRATYEATAAARREMALTLREQGCTYQQIADQMGTTANAVDKLLRARHTE